jgi:hypothetical protein
VLQLGGNDPVNLARCCKIAEEMGYDEINLNVIFKLYLNSRSAAPAARCRRGHSGPA